MRKPLGIVGSLAKSSKQKATRSATKAVYTAMWGTTSKKKKK